MLRETGAGLVRRWALGFFLGGLSSNRSSSRRSSSSAWSSDILKERRRDTLDESWDMAGGCVDAGCGSDGIRFSQGRELPFLIIITHSKSRNWANPASTSSPPCISLIRIGLQG